MTDTVAHETADIISLGSVNADFQVRIDRRPAESETLLGRDFVRLGGGKAANVALIARKLGRSVRLLARVGDDDLAEQALGPLRRAGIDLTGVGRVAGCGTGVAMIMVPPDGKKGIVLAPNANEAWTDRDLPDILRHIEAADAGAVLVLDCEIPRFVAEAAAAAARDRGLTRVLDPSPADRAGDLLALVDVVTPNPAEAETLTGIRVTDAGSAARAAERILACGPSAVLAKLPDGGCVATDGRRIVRVEGPPGDVIDTTGAGDAFAGALAVALFEHCAILEAARYAVAAARLAVGGYGSQPAYPDRATLEEALECTTLTELRT